MHHAPGRLPVLLLASALSLVGANAFAEGFSSSDPSSSAVSGVWLTTPYPDITESLGAPFTIDFSLVNKDRSPSEYTFSLDGLPDGWTYEIDGGGKKVAAAMVGPNDSRNLSLKLTPPADAKAGAYDITLTGKSSGDTLSVPLKIALAEPNPASLTIEPKLPALRGSAKSSFDYQLTLKNDSPADTVVNLAADAPAGFQTSFKEAYGSQELTSIPIKANSTKDIKLSVSPPQDADAGSYPVTVEARGDKASGTSQLELDVTGQPSLMLTGPGARLSGTAVAGKERSFKFTVSNAGTAPAEQVHLAANAPSGWEVDFAPKELPALAAGAKQEVEMRLTPSDKAIAGDYMVSVRSNAKGASDHADFRVTVETSTLWGIAGVGVIGSALLVLALAVTRYGRR
ncbi:NPCBM-associated, NEW3 domain of alpha-galactosidase [Hartmannibacter diazotrophicus]|uniref:NPCBM-associated, NEW3 domain of alpha-galactosidase n=1 Tax=Hartmannibacter diazotrophicus TaxID=1482074 RepID=A0A2C9DDL8_9HYPH|nr:NEW3 domain-containing protein [Hartmannibacter diazotrophicus]SON58404.1 NPCBM-associated, NEW3 domain of alpha-galactosidase [Hartmannibacter diazotrophicus]